MAETTNTCTILIPTRNQVPTCFFSRRFSYVILFYKCYTNFFSLLCEYFFYETDMKLTNLVFQVVLLKKRKIAKKLNYLENKY